MYYGVAMNKDNFWLPSGGSSAAAHGTKPSHRVKVVVVEKEKTTGIYSVASRHLEVKEVVDLA